MFYKHGLLLVSSLPLGGGLTFRFSLSVKRTHKNLLVTSKTCVAVPSLSDRNIKQTNKTRQERKDDDKDETVILPSQAH